MIQAIVFLPLIGAILAGLISIFGAHARNPSGDTVEHHDDAHGATLPICDIFSDVPNEDADLVAYAVPVLEVLLERGLTAG